jgi:hypothetical protein
MNHPPHPSRAAAPLGIWPCDPAPGEHELPELVEHLTPALLRRVVLEFAQPGDQIATAGIDPAALLTARHIGDRDFDFDFAAAVAVGQGAPSAPPPSGTDVYAAHSAEQPATVGLMVAAVADPTHCQAGVWQRWRRRLRPGGVLVVLTACPAGAVRFANNAGLVVTAATEAGLIYQQHIVAIHARLANDQLLPPPALALHPTDTRDVTRAPVQRPVHSDVLVFTNPTNAQDSGAAR